MKKILLSLSIMIALCVNSFAQDVPFIDVGLKLGANGASFGGLESPEENDGLKFGFVGGAYARFKLPVIGLFIQPELVYSQIGANTKEEVGGVSTDSKFKINTFDVNVLLGQRFGAGPIGIRINLGPTFSNVLSAKASQNDGDDVDIKDNLKSSLWSLQFGAGVDITKLSIDLRYQLGLSKLAEEDADNPVKANAIQLTLGFKIL